MEENRGEEEEEGHKKEGEFHLMSRTPIDNSEKREARGRKGERWRGERERERGEEGKKVK